MAAEAQRLKDQEELAKLRAEAAAREKAEQEAAQRRQIEEETRRKIEAEMADKQRQQDEARQKAEADAAAKRKAEEDEKKAAEAAENALRLPPLDRQHVQVALTALGFGTAGTDGTFGPRTREMIAAWQKARNNPPTGYLTGAQKPGAAARGGAGHRRASTKSRRSSRRRGRRRTRKRPRPRLPPRRRRRRAAVPPPPAPTPAAAAAIGPRRHSGREPCSARRRGTAANSPFHLQINVSGGTGTWVRPGSGPGTSGNQSRHASGSTDEQVAVVARLTCRAISRAIAADRDHARAVTTAPPPSPAAGPEAERRRPHLPDHPDAAMTRAAALI